MNNNILVDDCICVISVGKCAVQKCPYARTYINIEVSDTLDRRLNVEVDYNSHVALQKEIVRISVCSVRNRIAVRMDLQVMH